ncbi:DUF262 domain-containing protein [Streptomyces sp. NBC_01102]|uniref:DUF262 domain-containing protein n=1 Tax=Streptomyces sp. NBC_01102 TaxID=2903749 RepID=UPI0038684600|nr:DUF262 domain-containing protein [Streptomyces sp. NBC_01102]
MDELEDSGFRRPTGRERTVGYQRYVADWETDPIPGVHNPLEIGSDGLPTGIELEQPADEADSQTGVFPFEPESIKIETQASTVDLLLSRLREEMIDLAPDFQRRAGIWSDVQQSRLIESLLLRIPISSFHMAQDEDDNWAVVDGIQRLTSIARFMAPEAVGMEPLALRGLDYLHDFSGKRYNDLSGRLRIRLRETQLVVHIIQQGTPEDVTFNIFARINTGGMPLTRQEIRHALVKGDARVFLADLAEEPAFGEATGWSISNERMSDREMVLRFLAFRLSVPADYRQRDFDQFLVDTMHRINRLSPQQRQDEARQFREAMKGATGIFGQYAFRKWRGQARKSPINKALFETVAVNLANLADHERDALVASGDKVRAGFFDLMKDWDFDRAISIATGDPKKVQRRFEDMGKLFRGVLSSD